MSILKTLERAGYRRGLRTSIAAVLKMRFGEEGLKLLPEIHDIYEPEELEAILKAIPTAPSADAVRQLWASERASAETLESIEVVLRIRFGDEGLKLMPKIRATPDELTLRTIFKAAGTMTNLDDIRRFCLSPTP
jgi:hypothetical protein